MTEVKAKTRRGSLNRQNILEAALRLIDAEGSAALTMRNLADRLNVAPMSLYNHVRTRDDLLDGLSEIMVMEIGLIREESETPEGALRHFAGGIRSVAKSHPEAFELAGMRPLHTRAALVQIEIVLRALRKAGLSEAEAVDAYRAIGGYARGFARAEIAGLTLESVDRNADYVSGHGETAGAELPTVTELLPWLVSVERDESFEYGLDALIAGLDLPEPTTLS